ncbi:MAG: hypothetical protein FJ278_17440, partial [Planctomycetes bacterium]|nr:hypothetical protein [Planctomycetota bacterium]
MRFITHLLTASVLAVVTTPSMVRAEDEPWKKLYAGPEATGENVIALWQFLPGQEGKDNSGHGRDLTLRGQARYVKEGPFGAALESFPADKDNDKPQGA